MLHSCLHITSWVFNHVELAIQKYQRFISTFSTCIKKSHPFRLIRKRASRRERERGGERARSRAREGGSKRERARERERQFVKLWMCDINQKTKELNFTRCLRSSSQNYDFERPELHKMPTKFFSKLWFQKAPIFFHIAWGWNFHSN